MAVAGSGVSRGNKALQLEMSLPLAALTETPAVLQRGGPGGDGGCVQALLAACVGDLAVEHIGWVHCRLARGMMHPGKLKDMVCVRPFLG